MDGDAHSRIDALVRHVLVRKRLAWRACTGHLMLCYVVCLLLIGAPFTRAEFAGPGLIWAIEYVQPKPAAHKSFTA